MINVVYACNDAYAKQTLVSMVSVIKHNPDVHLYLIQDQMSMEWQEEIRTVLQQWNQSVEILKLAEVLPELELDERDRHPRTIYAKLFLAEHIPVSRILYLDSDVVVAGSLEALFTRDMEQELAAGVMMPYSMRLKSKIHAYPGEAYLCDGVILFNLELWRKENKSQECASYIKQHHGLPPMLSEGTLNHVCHGRIGTLAPKYNLMPSMLVYSLKQIWKLFRAEYYYTDENEMQEAKQQPLMIHFMNELYNRPWNEPCEHPYRDAYRGLATEIFGTLEWEKQPITPHVRRTVWMRKNLPFGLFVTLYHVKNRMK